MWVWSQGRDRWRQWERRHVEGNRCMAGLLREFRDFSFSGFGVLVVKEAVLEVGCG